MKAEVERPEDDRPSESYGRLLANLGLVALGLAAVAVFSVRETKPSPSPPAAPPTAPRSAAPAPTPRPTVVAELPAKPSVAEPIPPPEPPGPDPVAVARAEESVDSASRDRARAEARAEAAARALADAAARAAAAARDARVLASRVKDPSARFASAATRGQFLKAERDRLKGELAALSRAPRPQAKVLSLKNPVARPAEGNEFHFELKKGRVSYIDLERLLELVKKDAQLRIRLADGMRVVAARVGPVGPFSLEYSLSRSLPLGLDGLMGGGNTLAYNMRGWEVVPEFGARGESFEDTRSPISEFARAIGRLNPARESVTLWVYPDSFDLFRKLRDDLQARGFLVAARPLPDGMAIRGSPGGSLSAGQ